MMGEGQGSDVEAPCKPCTVRFASARPDVTARVLWVKDDDEEVEYARLGPGVSTLLPPPPPPPPPPPLCRGLPSAPTGWPQLHPLPQTSLQCCYNQRTYTTHPWRLRDAATGALLAHYVGGTATLTLLPGSAVRCEPGLHRPPPAVIEDPRWGAWRLRGAAAGAIPVLAFDCVSQEAVSAAEHVVEVGKGGRGHGASAEGAARPFLEEPALLCCGPDTLRKVVSAACRWGSGAAAPQMQQLLRCPLAPAAPCRACCGMQTPPCWRPWLRRVLTSPSLEGARCGVQPGNRQLVHWPGRSMGRGKHVAD